MSHHQRHLCCFIDRYFFEGCDDVAEFGFREGPEPSATFYACADHLGHVISPRLVGDTIHSVQVWMLLNGFDATVMTYEEIEAAQLRMGV